MFSRSLATPKMMVCSKAFAMRLVITISSPTPRGGGGLSSVEGRETGIWKLEEMETRDGCRAFGR